MAESSANDIDCSPPKKSSAERRIRATSPKPRLDATRPAKRLADCIVLFSATSIKRTCTSKSAAAGSRGRPFHSGGSSRAFQILSANCDIPSTARAYSLNVLAAP